MTSRPGDEVLRTFFDAGDRSGAPADLLARSLAQTGSTPQRQPLVARVRLGLLGIDAAPAGTRTGPSWALVVGVGLLLTALVGLQLAGALRAPAVQPGPLLYVTQSHPDEIAFLHILDGPDDPGRTVSIPNLLGCPVVSPDGTALAWTVHDGTYGIPPQNAIIVADIDGTNPRPVSDARYGHQIGWLGDGNLLAEDYSSGEVRFDVVAADGSATERLPALQDAIGVTPSPDGSRLAVIRANAPLAGPDPWTALLLSITNADGSGERRLLEIPDHTQGLPHGVRWSPDGRTIAFLGFVGEAPDDPSTATWELFVIDVANGDVRRLTDNDGTESIPEWSPDGRRLLFRMDDGPWIIDVETEEVTHVPVDVLDQEPPKRWDILDTRWTPDGSSLLVTTGRWADGGWSGGRLAILPLDGAPSRTIASSDGPDTVSCASWPVLRP